MSAISIKHLSKTYHTGVHALKNINLTVEAGDFFALLGPNGAGKTTIIGILTSLVTKNTGEVLINNISIDTDFSLAKTAIGVVPQEFNFSIFEKVEDIIVDQAGFFGIPRKEAMLRAEELMKALDLWEKRHQASKNLSGGMKRRLMIARALIHKPSILLLDEPTAGVDIELRQSMWSYLREMNTQGTTIILTTHYLEEVDQLCRNVAIVKKGEIVHQGSVKELQEKYGSTEKAYLAITNETL